MQAAMAAVPRAVRDLLMNPLAITALLVINAAFFFWTMRRRMAPILFGRKDVRWDRLPERAGALLKFGLGQKRLVDRGERFNGTAHVMIFAAFMVLAIRTIQLVGRGFSPNFE